MKSLGLERVFFTQLLLRVAATMIAIGAAFYFGRKDLCLIITLVCIFCLLQEFALQKDRTSTNNKKNVVEKDLSFFQNFASVFSSSILCALIPSYWISGLLILIFFILYEYLVSLCGHNSKYQWIHFENQIDKHIRSFMLGLNLESVYRQQCWSRIGVGFGILIVSCFFNVPMFGIACVRFSSYSVTYHFSKNEYKYQNVSDPRPFFQLLSMRIRWIVALGSVCIPLFFPHLWGIPIIILRILEPIEQKLSLFSSDNEYQKEYK